MRDINGVSAKETLTAVLWTAYLHWIIYPILTDRDKEHLKYATAGLVFNIDNWLFILIIQFFRFVMFITCIISVPSMFIISRCWQKKTEQKNIINILKN